MKLEDQVLNVEQVQELQELGFVIKRYSTMTIGDIINILPVNIEEYVLNINKLHVVYDSKTTNLFYAYRYRFIDSLFDCLVWCIKQKHIEL